jgi:threonine dehydrogenase-like Zn-dependent dehydrogenase
MHPPPIIPGHEAAGVVVGLEKDVQEIKQGDRVTMNPVQYCGSCYSCINDIEHLCLNTRHLGSGEVAGTWAEKVVVDTRNLSKIPDHVSFTAAALTEPAAVCYESFQRASMKPGDTVLIMGDGPFGFLHAQIAAALGAGKVICAGHHDQRLKRIHEQTGISICNTIRDDLETMIRTEVMPPGVDIVIEATGNGSAPNAGLRALRPRGTLVVFSYIWRPEIMDMGLIHMKELNVIGSCRSNKAFRSCLELMGRGIIDTECLVDLALPLSKYSDAFQRLVDQKADTFKVVFKG